MVKPRPKFKLCPSPVMGILEAHFSFNKELQDTIKVFPGVRYAPDLGQGRIWAVPEELAGPVCQLAESLGYQTSVSKPGNGQEESEGKPRNELHPYQAAGAVRLARDPTMLAFDPGLGKTVTALEALRLAEVETPLVVGPAIARMVWADQCRDWNYPWKPVVIETGKQADTVTWEPNRLYVTSYELSPRLLALNSTNSPGGIIFDESHMLKTGGSKRSMTACELVDSMDPRVTGLLTGTPIAKEPSDLWAQLDLIYPTRYGTYGKFIRRYCEAVENPYTTSGYSYSGLNHEMAEELHARLNGPVMRVTTSEVAHLLPPLIIQILRVKSKRKRNLKELLRHFDTQRLHQNKYEAYLLQDRQPRLKAAEQWAQIAREQNPHLLIFCWFRKTAQDLAKLLGGVAITGDIPPRDRHRLINEMKARPRGVTVATMASAGVAIDLTYCTRCLFAEMYPTPLMTIQALRRVHRLSSTERVTVEFLALRGTPDDAVARTLQERLKLVRSLYNVSEQDHAIEDALSEPKQTEEQWQARMRSLLAEEREEDEYL